MFKHAIDNLWGPSSESRGDDFPLTPQMTSNTVVPFTEVRDLENGEANGDCVTAQEASIRQALDAIKQSQAGERLDRSLEKQLDPFKAFFQLTRLYRPIGLGHVLLFLYSPFGLILMSIRIFFVILLALIIPQILSEKQMDRWLYRMVACITGTIVRVNNRERWDEDASIIVSNHISEFDALALRALSPCYILGYEFYKRILLFRLLGDKSGLIYVPYASRSQGGEAGRNQLRQLITDTLAKGDKKLAAFPEGGLTNGRNGLLQYHKFLFSLEKKVQPIALRASDGPFPVNINDETSTFTANVLWYFFVPWHTFRIDVLAATTMQPEENDLDFAQRVMRTTAQALDHEATPFLYRDKITLTRYFNGLPSKGRKR